MEGQRKIKLGEDRRFSVRWADKAHNSLSSFLHKPTVAFLTKTSANRSAGARSKAAELLTELEHITSSPVFGFHAIRPVEFTCGCGFIVRRSLEFLQTGKDVSCGGCGCLYQPTVQDDGRVRLDLIKISYICPRCQGQGSFPKHQATDAAEFECHSCGNAFRLSMRLFVEDLSPRLIPLRELDPGLLKGVEGIECFRGRKPNGSGFAPCRPLRPCCTRRPRTRCVSKSSSASPGGAGEAVTDGREGLVFDYLLTYFCKDNPSCTLVSTPINSVAVLSSRSSRTQYVGVIRISVITSFNFVLLICSMYSVAQSMQ